MNTRRGRLKALVPLLLAVLAVTAASFAPALLAPAARADDGMSGMEGMSAEEMQNMATPAPAPSATAMSGAGAQDPMAMANGADGHAAGQAMDPTMDMGGGSANWFVVGGFVLLIAGATLAAVLTKRHLRRRMVSGELAGAGVRGV